MTDTDYTASRVQNLDYFMANEPSGASYHQIIHYAQLIASNEQRFRRMDMGSAMENRVRYGTDQPPDYDLSQVKMPIAVFSGELDLLADPTDVKWLRQQLSHTIVFSKEYPFLGHLSFVVAEDMSYYLDDMIPLIQ